MRHYNSHLEVAMWQRKAREEWAAHALTHLVDSNTPPVNDWTLEIIVVVRRDKYVLTNASILI